MSDDTNLIFLPDIRVQVALASDAVIDQLGSFILDDPVKGVLDSGTLGLSSNWTDITSYVRSFSINRSATREQGPLWTFQAGTCSIVLDNSTGDFDPDNGASIFAASGENQIIPMMPVRIFAALGGINYGLYVGYADGCSPATITYQGDFTTITLSATDAFKVLSGNNLAEVSIEGISDDTGARVTDILQRVGWYTSAEWVNIDTGNSTLQGTTLGADALQLIQLAVSSEIGRFFVDGNGAMTFKSRHSLLTDNRSSAVVAVFGDTPGTSHPDGTELTCSSITRASDDTTLVNNVQATRVGGTLQQVTDDASVSKYLFPRSYERTDLILESDTETLSWAQWVSYVGSSAETRIESLTIDPQADSGTLWPYVLDAQFGDRIQVWVRPPGVADPITRDCFITGLQIDFDATTSEWTSTWTFQDASKYGSFLTLDNPNTGKLDSNALAF